MGTMEDVIRRIVREEISRAFTAAEQVADGADMPYETGEIESTALTAISKVMERVARDVLADKHPVLDTEHASTPGREWCTACSHKKHTGGQCSFKMCSCTMMPSTEPVHTITTVPERSRAACTCHRHTHVRGHDDRCGAPFCYCLSPVRARAEHASTEAPRTCPTCKHGVHGAGECAMHVYLRGVASPCPCPEWVRPEAVVSTRPNPMCTVCEHAPHAAYLCSSTIRKADGWTASCECGGRS